MLLGNFVSYKCLFLRILILKETYLMVRHQRKAAYNHRKIAKSKGFYSTFSSCKQTSKALDKPKSMCALIFLRNNHNVHLRGIVHYWAQILSLEII